MQKKFEKISRELEIIKLSHCFADSPRKQKEEAIERLIDKFPIKEMCRVLDLPVGTFYNYHLRRVDTTQNQIRDEYLKEAIIKIFNESGQRFCAPKIATKLSELGINTNKKKVSNLMEQMVIKSKQYKKRTFEKKQGKLASCKDYLMCAMGEGGAFMDNAIITQDAIPIRKLCPECRKYFVASVKSNGEVVGRCSHCHAKYFEQKKNNVRLIKVVQR